MSSRSGCPRREILPALLSLALCAASVLWLSSCATSAGKREFYVPARDEPLYGSWVAAGPAAPGARLDLFAWGLVQWYAEAEASEPSRLGSSLILARWEDDSGNTWYRELRRASPGTSPKDVQYVLDRVSGDGQELVSLWSSDGWPSPEDLAGSSPGCVRFSRHEQGLR